MIHYTVPHETDGTVQGASATLSGTVASATLSKSK